MEETNVYLGFVIPSGPNENIIFEKIEGIIKKSFINEVNLVEFITSDNTINRKYSISLPVMQNKAEMRLFFIKLLEVIKNTKEYQPHFCEYWR